MDPTEQTYAELIRAYSVFNRELFAGQLPSCLLTLQREKRTYGYFSSKRFGSKAGQTTDEIALNPEYFAVVPLVEILQTVVHEMVHLWQAHFGTPGRVRYHNAEWADKMESIGLMPSHTGKPGGRRVGDCMADYPLVNGRFMQVVNELTGTDGLAITWYDRFAAAAPLYPEAPPEVVAALPAVALQVAATQGIELASRPALPPAALNRSNRVKFSCTQCGLNAWAKSSARLACVDCQLELEPEGELALPLEARSARAARLGRGAAHAPNRSAPLKTPRSRP